LNIVDDAAATAPVTLTGSGGPPPPTCQPLTVSTGAGSTIPVLLNCTDATGATLSYAITGNPLHGSVAGSADFKTLAIPSTGQAYYGAASGFTGTDKFTYTASSVHGTSNPAVVQVSIGTSPSAWTLTAAGPIGKGAIVRPVLRKPHLIGLVVFRLPKHALVGFVPLGLHSGSNDRLPWNLKVNGKTLGRGSYEVDLKIFANGKPTDIAGPTPERLVIKNGRVRVNP
jgi:hypothetical protein